jgi:hypothetical protein
MALIAENNNNIKTSYPDFQGIKANPQLLKKFLIDSSMIMGCGVMRPVSGQRAPWRST